ncbi:hypothetical protein OHAE_295 [Ochrobactrum soli]|uniref:DUF1376 domain-containing protein n=2 Tax=Ochrobactrum soli TaxID=2448455 RepID=A0A2P9HK08_9HYPH|nr:hypothetical protein OHAE_295 [[Ochrobactrum] soli]
MPWVRFFPSDWLGGTRGMSAVETGIYITLIATMYERGEPIVEDHARLARLCGASNSAFRKALDTLIDEGKITRIDAGLWNDRVEKEQVYLSEKSEVGKRAGKASAEKRKQNQGQTSTDVEQALNEGSTTRAHKPEARSQIPDIYNSDPYGSGANAPVQTDYRNLVWQDGVASLMRQTGKTQSAAKSLVGKWLRDAKDNCRIVHEKILQAEVNRIGDPIPWISSAVRSALAASTQPTLADGFKQLAEKLQQQGEYHGGPTIEGSNQHRDFNGSGEAIPRSDAEKRQRSRIDGILPHCLPQIDKARD